MQSLELELDAADGTFGGPPPNVILWVVVWQLEAVVVGDHEIIPAHIDVDAVVHIRTAAPVLAVLVVTIRRRNALAGGALVRVAA